MLRTVGVQKRNTSTKVGDLGMQASRTINGEQWFDGVRCCGSERNVKPRRFERAPPWRWGIEGTRRRS